jgi:hypothetical protein
LTDIIDRLIKNDIASLVATIGSSYITAVVTYCRNDIPLMIQRATEIFSDIIVETFQCILNLVDSTELIVQGVNIIFAITSVLRLSELAILFMVWIIISASLIIQLMIDFDYIDITDIVTSLTMNVHHLLLSVVFVYLIKIVLFRCIAMNVKEDKNFTAIPDNAKEVYALPNMTLQLPTVDQTYQLWNYLYAEGRRLVTTNNRLFNPEYDQINREAFIGMIRQYNYAIKRALQTYDDMFNEYDEQLDNRYRQVFESNTDSPLFPIYGFLKEQHKWNAQHRMKLSNIQFPNPEEIYNEFESNRDDELFGSTLLANVDYQAFHRTMTSYNMEIMSLIQSKMSSVKKYKKRMNYKLKVLQKIQYSTWFQKMKWSIRLAYLFEQKQQQQQQQHTTGY